MKKERLIKVQAAYLAGCLSKDIMESYFPFIVNILVDNEIKDIHTHVVSQLFQDRYGFTMPMTVMREILTVGVRRGVFKYDSGKGRYWVSADLSSQRFDSRGFDNNWKALCDAFLKFCDHQNFSLKDDYSDMLLDIIEECEPLLLDVERDKEITQDDKYYDRFRFLWNLFVVKHESFDTGLNKFISSLGFVSVVKDMVFFEGDARGKFAGLKVYLDTPIIFAALGIEDQPRVDMCRYLITSLKESGCDVRIFDHCVIELDRIIRAADYWIHSSEYSSIKASSAGRYFFQKRASHEDIILFLESIEEELKRLGVSIEKTIYNQSDSAFQADECKLEKLIKERYEKSGRIINVYKEKSIRTDVRSIVFVDRNRKGYRTAKLYDSRFILATFNIALVHSAIEYDKNDVMRRGSIATCISADALGTILWLHSPVKLAEYKRLQLFADCYAATNPSQQLMDKYESYLQSLRVEGKITEEKFISCRASSAVRRTVAEMASSYGTFSELTCMEVIKRLDEESKYREELRVRELKKRHEEDRAKAEKEYESRVSRIKNDANDRILKHVANENEYKQYAEDMKKLASHMYDTNEKIINAISLVIAYVILFIFLCLIVGYSVDIIDKIAKNNLSCLNNRFKWLVDGCIAILLEFVLGMAGVVNRVTAIMIRPCVSGIMSRIGSH